MNTVDKIVTACVIDDAFQLFEFLGLPKTEPSTEVGQSSDAVTAWQMMLEPRYESESESESESGLVRERKGL